MKPPLYDDGVYTITEARISTPQRYYPLLNTTARIRRDPFWSALGVTGFSSLAILIYPDLLYWNEIVFLVGISGVALLLGSNFAVLDLAAVGQPRFMIVDRASKISTLYRVLCRAGSVGNSTITTDEFTDNDGDY